MRRAFRIDPAGAMRAPITGRIRQRVENLAARYGRAEITADWSFMLASCRLLLGEPELARLAIDDAVAFGDASESATNLLALVQPEAPSEMYGPEGETEIAGPEAEESSPVGDDGPKVASR